MTLGEALITPTKIYVKALKSIKESGVTIKGCSHITGGGFYENVPRMLHEGVRAVIEKDSYPMLPIFPMMQKKGNITIGVVKRDLQSHELSGPSPLP